MSELPAGLAPPLHIDEPPDWSAFLALAAVALLLVLWWLYRRRRAALRPPVRQPPAPAVATEPGPSLAAAVLALLEEFERHRDPRRGCHDLARLLREHLGSRRRRDFSVRTAREIRDALGDTPLGRAVDTLADLQFGRSRPSRNDFTGICSLVVEAVAAEEQR